MPYIHFYLKNKISGAQKRKKVKKAPGGDVESGEIPPVGEKSGA